MTISDDEKWLEKLSGKSDDISPGEGDRQVQVLRSVVTQQYRSDMDEMGEPDAQQLSVLLERCRDEGLLEKKKRWWGQAYWVPELSAVAMICLLLVVGVNVIGEKKATISDEIVYRGGPAAEMVKYVSAPMQAATELQRALEQAGIENVLIFQTGERWTVKTKLGLPLSDAVAAILDARKLDVPESGVLKVEFTRPE